MSGLICRVVEKGPMYLGLSHLLGRHSMMSRVESAEWYTLKWGENRCWLTESFEHTRSKAVPGVLVAVVEGS